MPYKDFSIKKHQINLSIKMHKQKVKEDLLRWEIKKLREEELQIFQEHAYNL